MFFIFLAQRIAKLADTLQTTPVIRTIADVKNSQLKRQESRGRGGKRRRFGNYQ